MWHTRPRWDAQRQMLLKHSMMRGGFVKTLNAICIFRAYFKGELLPLVCLWGKKLNKPEEDNMHKGKPLKLKTDFSPQQLDHNMIRFSFGIKWHSQVQGEVRKRKAGTGIWFSNLTCMPANQLKPVPSLQVFWYHGPCRSKLFKGNSFPLNINFKTSGKSICRPSSNLPCWKLTP